MTTTMQLLKEALETKVNNSAVGETISILISRDAAINLITELELVLNREDDGK